MSRLVSILFFLVLFPVLHFGQSPFITKWKTDNPGKTCSSCIEIPTTGDGYSYDIDWENDGLFDEFGIEGDAFHDYGVAGEYEVAIRGVFSRIYFGERDIIKDRGKIIEIIQWGDIEWKSMSGAFYECDAILLSAIDNPNLTNVISFHSMFFGCSLFTGDLSNWDVSNVTSMVQMFAKARNFESDLSNWDVSNVTFFQTMFQGASKFNSDLSKWDVSNATGMAQMFAEASEFNSDLSKWDVSNVESTFIMFRNATNFDSDLSEWDVSRIVSMTEMFRGAKAFNSDLSNWDVSSVTDMAVMFANASSFNSDLSKWDVSSVINMSEMFRNASSFNSDISDWDVSSAFNMNKMFEEASEFSGDLSRWNVSTNTQMGGMFLNAIKFNSDISKWNVSNVTVMSGMFEGAISFNQDISDWDVSKVSDMVGMFDGASSFNAKIGNWNVSNVTDMGRMFKEATSFDTDLGQWNLVRIEEFQFGVSTDLFNLFDNSGMSQQSYETTLLGWAQNPNTPDNLNLGALNLEYCDDTGRNLLRDDKGWTIEGDIKLNTGDSCDDGDSNTEEGQIQDNCECKSSAVTQMRPFITKWKTDNPGKTCSTCIEIPATGDGYNYDIDWENDGVFDEFGVTENAFHDYGVAGEYEVAIIGDFPRIYFRVDLKGDKDNSKIIDILQWGTIEWLSMTDAFYFCDSLLMTSTDIPDLSRVQSLAFLFSRCETFEGDLSEWDVSNITDMTFLFNDASNFNSDLSNWDVSNVTNMSSMFNGASDFNSDLSSWDVSAVTNMRFMFNDASDFNSDISNWDVSNVRNIERMFSDASIFNSDLSNWDVSSVNDMSGVFEDATIFNSDISNWNVSSVTDMRAMFTGAIKFDSDLSSWDVSSVTDMSIMFNGASEFNSDLSNWDVSSVTLMNGMFSNTANFNSDLSNWDVSNVTNMFSMFSRALLFNQNLGSWNLSKIQFDEFDLGFMLSNSGLSKQNYEATLLGWAQNSNTPDNLNLGASNLQYCDEEGRNILINDKGWVIQGDTKLTESEGCSEGIVLVDCSSTTDSIELNITIENPICAKTFFITGSAIVDVSGGSESEYQFKWSHTDADTNRVKNLPPGRYSVSVQDSNGCEASDSFDIIAPDSTGIEIISVIGSACNDIDSRGSVTVRASGGRPIANGTPGQYQYVFTSDSGVFDIEIAGSEITYSQFLSPGDWTVFVLDQPDFNLCPSDTLAFIVPNNSGFEFTFSDLTTKCEDGLADVVMEVNPEVIPLATISLTDENGDVFPLANPNFLQSGDLIEGIPPGKYIMNYRNGDGCIGIDSFIVIAGLSLEINENSVIVEQPVCDSDNLGSIIFEVTSGAGTLMYRWSDGVETNTASRSGLVPGTYNVTISVPGGCITSLSESFTIMEASASTDTSINITICEGESVTIVERTFTQSGQFSEILSSSDGCDSIINLDLTVIPDPSIDIELTDAILCPDKTDFRSLSLDEDLFAFSWESSTAQFSDPTADATEIMGLAAGQNIIRFTTTTLDDCSFVFSRDFTIFVDDQPRLQEDRIDAIYGQSVSISDPLANDDLSVISDGYTITVDQESLPGDVEATGQNQWSWIPAPGCLGEFILPYTVCNEACADLCSTSEVIINITPADGDEAALIPTGISPNGDGINDSFVIPILKSFPQNFQNNQLRIINRWGQTLYEAQPYANDWNGTDRSGSPLVQGTYYYHWDPGNGEEVVTGRVSILR